MASYLQYLFKKLGGSKPELIASNITASGATSSIDTQFVHTSWSMQLIYSSFSGTVDLQVSLKDTPTANDWDTIATWDTATQSSGDIITVSGKHGRHVRLNITVTSGQIDEAWIGVAEGL